MPSSPITELPPVALERLSGMPTDLQESMGKMVLGISHESLVSQSPQVNDIGNTAEAQDTKSQSNEDQQEFIGSVTSLMSQVSNVLANAYAAYNNRNSFGSDAEKDQIPSPNESEVIYEAIDNSINLAVSAREKGNQQETLQNLELAIVLAIMLQDDKILRSCIEKRFHKEIILVYKNIKGLLVKTYDAEYGDYARLSDQYVSVMGYFAKQANLMCVTLSIDEVPEEISDLMPPYGERLSVNDYYLLLYSQQDNIAGQPPDHDISHRIVQDMLQNVEYLALNKPQTLISIFNKLVYIESPQTYLLVEAICMQLGQDILKDIVVNLVKKKNYLVLKSIISYVKDIDSLPINQSNKDMLKEFSKQNSAESTDKITIIAGKLKGDNNLLIEWANNFAFPETFIANVEMCISVGITESQQVLAVLEYLYSINSLKPNPKFYIVEMISRLYLFSRNFTKVISMATNLKAAFLRLEDIREFIDYYADIHPNSDVIADSLSEESKTTIKFLSKYYPNGIPYSYCRQIMNNIGNHGGVDLKEQIVNQLSKAHLTDQQLSELLKKSDPSNIYKKLSQISECNDWLIARGFKLGDFPEPANVIEQIIELANNKELDDLSIKNKLAELLATESAAVTYSSYIASQYNTNSLYDLPELSDLLWQNKWVQNFFARLNIPEQIAKDILLAWSKFNATYNYYIVANLLQDNTNGPGSLDLLSILDIFKNSYSQFFEAINNAINVMGLESFVQVYQIFGFKNFHRYNPNDLLNQLNNWQQGQVSYKYIVMTATGDYNGAFSSVSDEIITSVQNTYSPIWEVVFFEVDSKLQASQCIAKVGKRERDNGRDPRQSKKITTVIINVHGEPYGVTFFDNNGLQILDYNIAKDFIISDQGKAVKAKPRDYSKDIGNYRVIFRSCLTARSSASGKDNFVDTVANYYNVDAVGSGELTYRMVFNADGSVSFHTTQGLQQAITAKPAAG